MPYFRPGGAGNAQVGGSMARIAGLLAPGTPTPRRGSVSDDGPSVARQELQQLLKGVNKKEFKMAESPSAGTVASARGLALLAAAMADQGQVGNYETAINQKFRVTISSAKNLLKYCLFDCQGPRGRPATDVRRDVELDARGADQAQNLSVSRDQLQPGRSQLLWVSGLLILYYRYSAARMRGPRSKSTKK